MISGLPVRRDVTDAEQFANLCLTHFHINPPARSMRRLGTPKSDRIQPLLVTLGSANDVNYLLSLAKNLRQSKDAYTRDHVYVNRHMTEAESLAAYKIRQRRRLADRQIQPTSPAAIDNHLNKTAAAADVSMNNNSPVVQAPSTSGRATLDPSVQPYQPHSNQSH